MRKSKIILTKHQLDFASSTEYPLTKQAIISNVIQLFEELGTSQKSHYPHFQRKNYKISRGENYESMPFVVLDFPQISSPTFPILMRTFFWWGHYFSFNLLVRKDLITLGEIHLEENAFVLQSDDLWNNNIEHDYQRQDQIDLNLISGDYIRLVKTIPINHYANLDEASAIYDSWLKAMLIFEQKKGAD